MSTARNIIDPWFRQRVREAQRMSSDEKLLAGARLFDYACEVTKAGIRAQRPEVSEKAVGQLLIERLALRRQLERAGQRSSLQERWL